MRPRRRTAALVVPVLALLSLSPAAASPGPVGPARTVASAPFPAATDRIIVQFAGSVTAPGRARAYDRAAAVAGIPEAAGATEVRAETGGSVVLELPGGVPEAAAERLAAALGKEVSVDWAQPDHVVTTAGVPDDPSYGSQWALHALDLPTAWDTATGVDVVIGVVDTGITRHDDLDPAAIGGHDFVSSTAISNDGDGRDADPADPADPGTHAAADQCYPGSPATTSTWHGTLVAGIAAAATDNGYGIAGSAPGAKIRMARALGACGSGYLSDVVDAVRWLAGAPVPGVAPPRRPLR